MAQELTVKKPPGRLVVSVETPGQARSAALAARTLAESIGFTPAASEEIALATSELASNLIKHAGGGDIELKRLDSAANTGIEIVSQDKGPGIVDIELALTDGYSTVGSLGVGLGAINRLMDALQFCPGPLGGLRVVCQRWVRTADPGSAGRRLAFGAATRSYHLIRENGDTFVIRQWGDHALAGIIDGLGHGEFAQRASQAARQYLENHFDQPLESLFQGAARACRATRGVVMALVRFDLARAKVTVAGVGNIEVRVLGHAKALSPIIRRGIVGLPSAPRPVSTEHAWDPESLLIMHSDGVQTRWTSERFKDLTQDPPDALARRLLHTYGRPDDDATVLVARNADAILTGHKGAKNSL